MTYSIGQAAEMLGLSTPTLRYYDKEGLLPFVDRSQAGIRIFSQESLEWLQLIECLKATGMPIKDIKQFIDWYIEGDRTIEQRRAMFHERRRAVAEQIAALQQTLDFVDYKCRFYDAAAEAGTTAGLKQKMGHEHPEGKPLNRVRGRN